jgi:drug/metabolite transporter (DMT)-like permease
MLASIFLGLAAALGWGVADFLARSSARRIGAYRTLFFMQCFGLAALSGYWALAGGAGAFLQRGPSAWTWAVVCGAVNAASSLALYRSFETGILAVVAPISASYPALTVLLAVHSGEKIGAVRAAGIAAAIAGVVLAAAARAPGAGKRGLGRGVPWAIFAAVGYAVNFWLLGFTVVPAIGSVASVWVIRVTTVATLALVAVPVGQKLRAPRGLWGLLAAIGVLDTLAFVANNQGLGLGHVSVVTVLASLYAAVTVLLAALVLREKLGRRQWLGVFLILAGVALISA